MTQDIYVKALEEMGADPLELFEPQPPKKLPTSIRLSESARADLDYLIAAGFGGQSETIQVALHHLRVWHEAQP